MTGITAAPCSNGFTQPMCWSGNVGDGDGGDGGALLCALLCAHYIPSLVICQAWPSCLPELLASPATHTSMSATKY